MSVADQVHEKLNNGDNWMKGDTTDGVGNYCILGALNVVSGGYTSFARNQLPIANAIHKLFPDRISPYDVNYGGTSSVIASFNDDEATIWEDVSLVLKHASKTE